MCLEGKIKGWVDGLDWGQQCWRNDQEWLPGGVFNSSMFDPSPIHELCPDRNKDLWGPLCPAGASLLQETLRIAELINSARVTCLKKQIWTCWFRFKDFSALLLFCTRVPQGTWIAGFPRLGGGHLKCINEIHPTNIYWAPTMCQALFEGWGNNREHDREKSAFIELTF